MFLSPKTTTAQSNDGSQVSNAAQQQATLMVPAQGALTDNLDAKKTESGHPIKVTLSNKVQLKNGPELPSGTVIRGTVVADDAQISGKSKLALRFTEAALKNGQVIPIKATIVGFVPPNTQNIEGVNVPAGNQEPNFWTAAVLQVDQVGAESGVELHSKIDSANSGVLVSTKKDDLKLSRGSEIELAIAKQ